MRAALKSGMVLEGTQAELIALLSDRVLEVRYQSALALRDLCGMRLADEEAVMPLIAAVDDVSVEIATLAAKALPPLFVRFGPVEEAKTPLLRGLRAADDAMVRACLRGLLTLSMMGADVDPPREALETLSKSGDYRTRRLAEQLRRRLGLEGRSNG
jgi:hypothetical protein